MAEAVGTWSVVTSEDTHWALWSLLILAITQTGKPTHREGEGLA